MMPKPHHRQYYSKAEMQRYRCAPKFLNTLDVVDKIIGKDVQINRLHHFYQKLLTALGFEGSSEPLPIIHINQDDFFSHYNTDVGTYINDGRHPWKRKAITNEKYLPHK